MTNFEIASANSLSAASLRFRIGDITIHIDSDDARLKLCVQGAAKQFLVSNSDADVNVRARLGELGLPPTGKKLFDSGHLWQLYRQERNYLFRFTSPAIGSLPYKQACFSPDFTAGEIVLHGDYLERNEPVDPLEYPLDELLMVNLLAQGRGVEVHACGVEDSDGHGYLFVGQSEAGKTTMARLWEKAGGALLLSDDRIILRCLEGRIWMYGTPWHGEAELASPARAPLSRIFFLLRRPKNELVPLMGAAAVARLMACSFVPFYSPSGLESTLAFYQEVTETIPCFDLGSVPDSRAVEFVRKLR
jgi:hypothetical protein